MGFRPTVLIRPCTLLAALLWLSACDIQQEPKKPDVVEPESESVLLDDGFYGQDTAFEDKNSGSTTVEQITDVNNSSAPANKVILTELGSDSDEAESAHSEKSADSEKSTHIKEIIDREKSNNGENIVANIGFSEPQEQAPVEAAEYASSFACAASNEPTSAPQLSSNAICKRISNRLASVSMESCEGANLKPSQCKSVKDFPILYTEFPPLSERDPLGRILVVGGTHGDELTSVSIVFRWIGKLNKFHSGLFHWRLAPMLNPDGVLKRGATRTNQNGVDLNRNLPSNDWDENAIKYWTEKSNRNKRRYPGPAAGSEPETRWLIDQINTFRPDAIISVHAPYGVVDYDALILNTAPKNLGKLALNLLGTYPGSLGNYAGINLDIPVITLELPHAWEMPSEKESTKIWEDIVSWLRKNVNNQSLAEN